MSEANELREFQQPDALRDGTPIMIRIARTDDRQRLVAAFAKLDPQSIYTRFFGYRKELSESLLGHLDAPDFDSFVALLVTLGSGADEVVIGAASYVVLDPSAAAGLTAEVAFLVEEDFHGQGLAGKLLAALIDVARRRGITRFDADVLAGNAAMLRVFRRAGLPMTTSREGGAIHLAMELAAGAPR